jgi:hypothetical protein
LPSAAQLCDALDHGLQPENGRAPLGADGCGVREPIRHARHPDDTAEAAESAAPRPLVESPLQPSDC